MPKTKRASNNPPGKPPKLTAKDFRPAKDRRAQIAAMPDEERTPEERADSALWWLSLARDALVAAGKELRELKAGTADNLKETGPFGAERAKDSRLALRLSPYEAAEEAKRIVGYATGLLSVRLDMVPYELRTSTPLPSWPRPARPAKRRARPARATPRRSRPAPHAPPR